MLPRREADSAQAACSRARGRARSAAPITGRRDVAAQQALARSRTETRAGARERGDHRAARIVHRRGGAAQPRLALLEVEAKPWRATARRCSSSLSRSTIVAGVRARGVGRDRRPGRRPRERSRASSRAAPCRARCSAAGRRWPTRSPVATSCSALRAVEVDDLEVRAALARCADSPSCSRAARRAPAARAAERAAAQERLAELEAAHAEPVAVARATLLDVARSSSVASSRKTLFLWSDEAARQLGDAELLLVAERLEQAQRVPTVWIA